MPGANSADPKMVDELLEAGDLDSAREALSGVSPNDDSFMVVQIKLAMYDGSLPPGAAMQKLIQLMRRDSNWPGAKELYQEASQMAYSTRQSSIAHSHPPPPINEEDD
jgi:hypothetical protein